MSPTLDPQHLPAPPPWPENEPVPGLVEPEVNVREYLYLVWSRRWLVLAVTAVVLVLGTAWTLTRPKLYRATTELSVGERQPQVIQSRLDMGPNYWELERFVDEQVRVLTTRKIAARVADALGMKGDLGLGANPSGALRGMIRAERIEGTNIIRMTITSRDPARAAEWLNLYVDEYIEASIEDTLNRATKVYNLIEERLEPLREQLVESEQQLMTFRERKDALLFADQDKNVITEQVNTLTTEYANAKAERIRLETKIAALASMSADQLAEIGIPDVAQDATLTTMRGQRAELQVELADKLRTLREGHPTIKDLRGRIAGIDTSLNERIASIRTSLQTDFAIVSRRESSLFSNIQQLKEQSIELSKQTMEYERLKRDYDQNKAFLEDMLARSKEVDITKTTRIDNIRVIEPAVVPTAPFTPNVRRGLSLSLVLGLFLGVGLVLGLDFLDQTLRSPEQVERQVGLEVLGVLPTFSEANAPMRREAFQSLRTALMLAARGEGCQMLMVTSAAPGEGKTVTAGELGNVLTTGGSRVLMIDADLRKPRLHRIAGVDKAPGLTSVVLGESQVDDVLRTINDVPGLQLITSGALPPNPPELFGKGSFKKLLEWARQRYDWVVIDTPPVGSVTDPVICSRLVDMALLVVEYGRPKRQLVRNTVRQLGRTGVRIPGVLFNKVNLEREHYYYYSPSFYRYGYYRYAYTDDEEEQTQT